MASDVTVRTRFRPGVGHDSAGNPRQGKREVHGQIDVTSYTQGGESLSPQDLGLTTIDYISLKAREPVFGSAGGTRLGVEWSPSSNQFYIFNAGTNAEIAAASARVVQFHAVGDSAGDVELT